MENQKKGILQFLHKHQPDAMEDAFTHNLVDFFTEAKASANNEVLRMQLNNLLELLHSLFPEGFQKDIALSLEHLNVNVYCASIAWFEPGDPEKETLRSIEFCEVILVMRDQQIVWLDRPGIIHIPEMKPIGELTPLLTARGVFWRPHLADLPWSMDYRITALLETKPTVH